MFSPGEPDDPGREPDSLIVGVLVGPHGLRGELKLRPLTEFPERIPQLPELRLRYPDGTEARRRLLAARFHRQMFLLTLEGIETIEDAEALRGASVLIDRDQAAPLPEGRYYEHQLLGLRVLTPGGEELGRISEIIPGASNDVYVAGRYMIPATHDAVLRIAPEEGVLIVRSKEYLEGEEVR
jgi:16S rRNA processing protein RimM